MTPRAEIMGQVSAALDGAEELAGPEGAEYVGLMRDVIALALERLATYAERSDPPTCDGCGAPQRGVAHRLDPFGGVGRDGKSHARLCALCLV